MTYDLTKQSKERIEINFTCRPLIADQQKRQETICFLAVELAHRLTVSCPPSRELSLAMTKLEECVMWASEAIVRNEAVTPTESVPP